MKILWIFFWLWIAYDIGKGFGGAITWGLHRWAKKTDDPKKALVLAAMWGILEIHGWRTIILSAKLMLEQFRKGRGNA